MAKRELDKYYTSKDLAKYCIELVYTMIPSNKITHIIEPSAGNGSFSTQLDCDAYDIEPEHEAITRQDYLSLDITYKEGRLIIGNPPYGRCLNQAQRFYKKSVELGDYIGFILPISQLWNTQSMYEFDLIYSEDLGRRDYSGVKLHCCFNVYERNSQGLNEKPKTKIKDISICRQDSKGYADKDFDLRICQWGNGSAGKVLQEGESYSAEYKLKIHNEAIKEQVIELLNTVNWREELNCIAMLKIQQFHIINYLKKHIPELE